MLLFMYVLGLGIGYGYRTLRAILIDRPREFARGVDEGVTRSRQEQGAAAVDRTMPEDHHPFSPYPSDRYPNSCMRCGRVREAPVHEGAIPTVTDAPEATDGRGD